MRREVAEGHCGRDAGERVTRSAMRAWRASSRAAEPREGYSTRPGIAAPPDADYAICGPRRRKGCFEGPIAPDHGTRKPPRGPFIVRYLSLTGRKFLWPRP